METTGKNSGTLCHERHVGDEDERDRGRERKERRGEMRHGEKEDERERPPSYENDVRVAAVDIDAPSGH